MFIRIPKAANTALLYNLYLSTNGTPLEHWNRDHITYNHFQHLGGSTLLYGKNPLRTYTFFTVSRNPFSRALSAYLQKFSMNYYINKFPEIKPSEPPTQEGFVSFLEYLKSGGLYKDHHWIPQTDFLWPNPERLDFTLKTETLRADTDQLLNFLNLPTLDNRTNEFTDLINKGSKPTNSFGKEAIFYQGDLGARAKKMVIELYKNDFYVFNYSIEP